MMGEVMGGIQRLSKPLVERGMDRHVDYVDATFTEDALHVVLADGREVSAPLQWFPRLLRATPEQRAQWELIGDGIGIHWPLVDEDIEVESLLAT